MSKQQSIERCPFCGGKGNDWWVSSGYFIECDKCKATTNNYEFKKDAIQAWNRRIK